MTPRFAFTPLTLMAVFIVVGSVLAGNAFASEYTRPSPIGGEGLNAISGYAVTNVGYHSNSDPTRIDSVSFTLNSPANLVKIKLVESQSQWYNCHPFRGNDWVCDTTGASMQSADQLTVVASGK
jgi:hypothetical protein